MQAPNKPRDLAEFEQYTRLSSQPIDDRSRETLGSILQDKLSTLNGSLAGDESQLNPEATR